MTIAINHGGDDVSNHKLHRSERLDHLTKYRQNQSHFRALHRRVHRMVGHKQ